MWYDGFKKTAEATNNTIEKQVHEADELYWFIGRKPRTETRENTYIITMVSRRPRQIVGFDVAYDKSPERVQRIVDDASSASEYWTDGWFGYIAVVDPGRHVRNMRNKSDTFTVEGVNADLRHYIPGLARRRRCFYRSLDTLRAVLQVSVYAYNRLAKLSCAFKTPNVPSLIF